MAKEDQAPAEKADAATETTEYVEYVGYPPYGSQFDDVRSISRREAKEAWDVSIPKDLRWEKETKGRNRGRMLLPANEVPAEVMDLLLEDSAFKRVEV